jgi:transcriptional regulator of acetoin/glycerol metabolism
LRVVSATHVDLHTGVEKGKFRTDLLARLAGYEVELPPLRDRLEDLGSLIAMLLRVQLSDRGGDIVIEREATRALYAYDWPRNIRELGQALAVSNALRTGLELRLEQLPLAIRGAHRTEKARSDSAPSEEPSDLRERLARLLQKHGGNVSAIARELGKERVQIRRWCRRFDLDPQAFRTE